MVKYAIVADAVRTELLTYAISELKEWISRGYEGKVSWCDEADDADIVVNLVQDTAASSYGFLLDSDGRSATVTSATDRGLLYGVYGLLERLFSFVPYAVDEIQFQPKAYDVLPEFHVSEEPSFPWRMYLCSQPDRERQKQLLRLQDNIWAGPQGRWFHTSLLYLPYEIYGSEHPEWYGEKNEKGEERQLCYSALLEDPEAYAHFLEAAKKITLENPDKPNLSVTHEDSVTWCECPRCQAAAGRYGAESATMILFINKLARDLRAWRQREGMMTEFNVVAFAYYRTLKAPVKKEDGHYVPTSPDIVLEDNVGIIYAPIEMDYSKPFSHPDNAEFAENLRKWRAICKKLYVWTYQTNFRYFLAPYDWFPTVQENYRFCRDLGVYCYYDQGQYTQTNATVFNTWKTFLTARLMWNADEDQEKLTDDFFTAYYDIAAPWVRKYYDEVLVNNQRWHREVGIGVEWYIYFEIIRKDVWHEEDLRRWNEYLEQALIVVEESDLFAERKEQLKHRIGIEKLAPMYLLAGLYDTSFEAREAVIRELERFKVGLCAEGKSVSALAEDWLNKQEGDGKKE